MKNKIIAICISVLVGIAFVVPASIFGEENALDSNSQPTVENNQQIGDDTNSEEISEPVNTSNGNEVVSETESSADENIQDEEAEDNAMEPQMAKSPQKAPEVETEWDKLKKKIESVGSNGKPVTVTIDKDISGDPAKDKTIEIKSGQNVILKGAHGIKGIGYSSFIIAKGGSLTIDGPSISNAQTITEGDLTLNSGKISDTKLEGPTIFVNSGTFTMNGGEVSGNEAVESSTPQPAELKSDGTFYLYSPITVYSGTFTLNAGKISGNRSFLKGGAIGAWGTESSIAGVVMSGGEITGNQAEHSRLNARGGSIYLENCDFEMSGGSVSESIAELGGGIAAIKSTMTFKGGNITENTNGDYKGLGGGIFADNSRIKMRKINISQNYANGAGGGVYFNDCKYTIDGGAFNSNSSRTSGGALAADGTCNGEINVGLFQNNSSNGFWGGGAIYNDTKCELVINRALIRNNSIDENFMIGAGNHPPSRQGGGIWNCPTGNTTINITNGLALFDNSAKNSGSNIGAGDDFANITKYEYDQPAETSSVRLASRMLGGGYRLWYQDGSFYGIHTNLGADKQEPRYGSGNKSEPLPYNENIYEKRGAQLVYKSVPDGESKALAERIATSVFQNNRALGTGISGGAITNNGKLIFGENEPYTLKIMKSWTGDKKKDRPKEITLKVYVGDHYVEDIKLKESKNWTTEIKDFPDPDTLKDNKTGKILPINFKEKDGDKYLLTVVSRVKDSKEKTYTIQLDNSINTSVKVTKKWIDNENKRELRPGNITVGLLANGKDTGKTLVLSDKTNWKGEFEKLPMYDNDEIVKYEVKEISKIKGYTSKIEGNASDGFTITNTINPDKPPKKPKSPETSDSNKTYILCIALTAASLAVIHILRRKKKL